MLFSDLEGFTKMSHAIPPEMVATLLNRYLDMLSEVVLEHGGGADRQVRRRRGGRVLGRADRRPRRWEAAARRRLCDRAGGRGVPQRRPARGAADRQDPRRAAWGRGGGRQLRRKLNRIQYTALGDSHRTPPRASRRRTRRSRSWSWRAASSPNARGSTAGGRWAHLQADGSLEMRGEDRPRLNAPTLLVILSRRAGGFFARRLGASPAGGGAR